MSESKTALRSMQAGMNREVKKDPFDTPEKMIAELRKQREAKLAVVRYDFIDALLAEYDKERAAVAHLGGSTASLLKRAEKAEGQLDIVVRELEGEPADTLAADYGGTGWELEPQVVRARKALSERRENLRIALTPKLDFEADAKNNHD